MKYVGCIISSNLQDGSDIDRSKLSLVFFLENLTLFHLMSFIHFLNPILLIFMVRLCGSIGENDPKISNI